MRSEERKKPCCKKEVVLFLICSFFLPLICYFLMEYIPLFSSGILNLILYGIEAASPMIASLFCVIFFKQEKISDFLEEKYIHNISLKYCVIGFLIPASILLIGKILTNLVVENHGSFMLPTPKKLLIITWALVAEELGWRGYLQERLEMIIGDILTPLAIGILWSLWHYHFWLSGSMETPILMFIYGCITESYGYYLLTHKAKGNILPASICHFSGNLFLIFF